MSPNDPMARSSAKRIAKNSKSERTKMRSDWKKIVTVIFGKEPFQETFIAHEGILCAISVSFRVALNGSWKESKDRIVQLPEEDLKTFGDWFDFTYRNIVTDLALPDTVDRKERQMLRAEHFRLCLLYVLADRLRDATAKNAVVTAIFDLVNSVRDCNGDLVLPGAICVEVAYVALPETSKLSRLLVELLAEARGKLVKDDMLCEILPKEFLRDVAVLLQSKMDKPCNIALGHGKERYLERVE